MLLHSKAVCGRVVILLVLIPSPLLEILGNSHTTIPRLAFLNVPLVLCKILFPYKVLLKIFVVIDQWSSI